jgi:hypothetical protein
MRVTRVTNQGYIVCTWWDPDTRQAHERMFFPEMLEAYAELPSAEAAAASNPPIAPVEPTNIPSAEIITQSGEPVPGTPAEAVAALKAPPNMEEGSDSPVGGSTHWPSADES